MGRGINLNAICALIQIECEAIVDLAFLEAISVMASMTESGNEGQQSTWIKYVEPEFIKIRKECPVEPNSWWKDVLIVDKMDYMGEIIEAGNQIMNTAYAESNALFELCSYIIPKL